jgi:hypothetical protein
LQPPKVLTEADARIVAALVGLKHDSGGSAALFIGHIQGLLGQTAIRRP